MEVLTQDEIDHLLTAINADDFKHINFQEFESFLTKRQYQQEKPYGIFDKDVTMCRFFGANDSENILADIERKNKDQGMGNITISGTKIKLINYSFCPKCNEVFSFKDLAAYYSNPRSDPAFASRTMQFRNDTRVYCHVCNDYFLPALVISDGTPKNEVQFLCRIQTVNAIENYFLERKTQVLTRNKKNIIHDLGKTLVLNDIVLEKLKEKPTLITNLIQYTPADLMFNLIDGSNVEKRDMLFGGWGI